MSGKRSTDNPLEPAHRFGVPGIVGATARPASCRADRLDGPPEPNTGHHGGFAHGGAATAQFVTARRMFAAPAVARSAA